MMTAGAEAQIRERVIDGERQTDADTTQVVDHLLESGEIELDEVVEMQPRGLLDGLE